MSATTSILSSKMLEEKKAETFEGMMRFISKNTRIPRAIEALEKAISANPEEKAKLEKFRISATEGHPFPRDASGIGDDIRLLYLLKRGEIEFWPAMTIYLRLLCLEPFNEGYIPKLLHGTPNKDQMIPGTLYISPQRDEKGDGKIVCYVLEEGEMTTLLLKELNQDVANSIVNLNPNVSELSDKQIKAVFDITSRKGYPLRGEEKRHRGLVGGTFKVAMIPLLTPEGELSVAAKDYIRNTLRLFKEVSFIPFEKITEEMFKKHLLSLKMKGERMATAIPLEVRCFRPEDTKSYWDLRRPTVNNCPFFWNYTPFETGCNSTLILSFSTINFFLTTLFGKNAIKLSPSYGIISTPTLQDMFHLHGEHPISLYFRLVSNNLPHAHGSTNPVQMCLHDIAHAFDRSVLTHEQINRIVPEVVAPLLREIPEHVLGPHAKEYLRDFDLVGIVKMKIPAGEEFYYYLLKSFFVSLKIFHTMAVTLSICGNPPAAPDYTVAGSTRNDFMLFYLYYLWIKKTNEPSNSINLEQINILRKMLIILKKEYPRGLDFCEMTEHFARQVYSSKTDIHSWHYGARDAEKKSSSEQIFYFDQLQSWRLSNTGALSFPVPQNSVILNNNSASVKKFPSYWYPCATKEKSITSEIDIPNKLENMMRKLTNLTNLDQFAIVASFDSKKKIYFVEVAAAQLEDCSKLDETIKNALEGINTDNEFKEDITHTSLGSWRITMSVTNVLDLLRERQFDDVEPLSHRQIQLLSTFLTPPAKSDVTTVRPFRP